MASNTNGKICYIEIPSDDISGSSAFYQKIFGWNIRTRGDGSVSFDDSTGQVSGVWILNRKPDNEPGIFIYIMVDSIATTIDSIKTNGGKIIDIHLEGKEKIAKFSDPAGNVFGLYQESGQ